MKDDERTIELIDDRPPEDQIDLGHPAPRAAASAADGGQDSVTCLIEGHAGAKDNAPAPVSPPRASADAGTVGAQTKKPQAD